MIDYLVAFAIQGAIATGAPLPEDAQPEVEHLEQVASPAPKNDAQPPEDAVADSQSASPSQAPTQPQAITIPAKHPIIISIEGQVGSKISEPKDMFPIKLVQPVVIDGREVLPAGITGEGKWCTLTKPVLAAMAANSSWLHGI